MGFEKNMMSNPDSDVVSTARYEKDAAERERSRILERIEERQKNIEKLESDISAKKGNWVSRLIEFRKLRELEGQLQIAREARSLDEEDRKRTDELVAAYETIIQEEEALVLLKKEETEKDQERVAVAEQEDKMRSIAELSRKHGAFFVHDIVSEDWKPAENNRALDTKTLSWEDQVDIITGLGPTVSASSLREGVKGDGTFGRAAWGVFLGEGKVLGGSRTDIGTQAFGLYDREVPDQYRNLSEIDRAINSADDNSAKQDKSYNELVIERPEVAGVYFKWTERMPDLEETTSLQNTQQVNYDKWWKRLRSVTERKMPIFVLTQDNRTRMIYDIDFEKRIFRVAGADMQPQDMVDLPGIYKQHLGDEEKKKMVQRQIKKVGHLLTEQEHRKYQE